MNPLLDKIVKDFKRDWRRTGVLIALVLVAAVVIGRQLVGSPQADAADSPLPPSKPVVRATASRQADKDAPAVPAAAAIELIPAGPHKVFAFTSRLDDQAAVFVRDPFHADLGRFPADEAGKPALAATSSAEPTEPDVQRGNEAAIQSEAGKLKLQMIMMAAPPRVMIGKSVYQVGQFVGRFKVTSITPNSAVLESDGFQVTLHLE